MDDLIASRGRADRRRRVELERDQGIDRFEAEVLAGNRPMLALLAQGALPMSCRTGDGVVLVEPDLAGAGAKTA